MYTFPLIPFRYSKTATVAIMIIVLCLIPSDEFSKLGVQISFADIIVHFIMFFTFSAALVYDITRKRTNPLSILQTSFITFILSLALAASTELLQHFITPLHRTGSITDLVFDLLGTLSGIAFMLAIRRIFAPAT